MAESEKPVLAKSKKSDGVPRNHDERMELENAAITQELENELARQDEFLKEQERIAADVDNRANFNVTVVDHTGEADPVRFETLSAVVVYGRKGSARYDVEPGDVLIKVVFENSSPPEKKKAEKKDEAE